MEVVEIDVEVALGAAGRGVALGEPEAPHRAVMPPRRGANAHAVCFFRRGRNREDYPQIEGI